MKRHLATLALALTAAVFSAPSSAVLLSFVPASTSGNIGDNFTVDVVVSGLQDPGFSPPELVSAFDISVLFNSSVLSFVSGTYSGALGDPLAVEVLQGDPPTTGPGNVNIWAVSLLPDDPDLINGIQGLSNLQTTDSVILASLTFHGDALGVSSLTYDYGNPSATLAGRGAQPLQFTTANGCIGVGTAANCTPPNPAPEPTTPFLLLGAGLALLASRRYAPGV